MKYVAVISMTTLRFSVWAMDRADEAFLKGLNVVRLASPQIEIDGTRYVCVTNARSLRGRRWDDIIFLEDWDACLSIPDARYILDTAAAHSRTKN